MIKIIIVSLATLCYVRAQSQCRTPRGAAGQCIPIVNCPPLLALVQNEQRTNEDVKLLKDSHCGFDENKKPMVCCQQNAEEDRECFTPDGKLGSCIDFHSCNNLKNLLSHAPISKDNINYVQSSKCESPDNYSVCCGPPVDPSVRPMRNCEPSIAPPDPRTECCGLDSSSGNRIFGGNVTAIDQYPWLVLVEYRGLRDDRIKLLCGGVLISSRYVLTAGHCVAGPVLRVGIPTNVRLGEYDTSSDGPDCVEVEGGGQDCTEGTKIISIEKIIPHRDYDPNSALRRNDIALLRLSEAAPYSDFIRPICLPQSDIGQAPQTLYAAGWGAVSDTQSFSGVKLHVDLPYRTLQECQPSYQVAKRRVQLWKGQLCAGGVAGKDSCKGDSGGPLMSDNGRIYTVVGIVSFGPTPCGMENVPGVYTKVFEYLPWIRSQMKP